jgi:hypothetical protein
MKHNRRIVVVGTFGNVPYAGMAWMHCQFLVGLARLGHEVSYVETTTAWPYHPTQMSTTNKPEYALAYVGRVLDEFGLGDRWAYRAAYADDLAWHGPLSAQAVELIRSADAVFNISGSTAPEEIGVPCRLTYIGTDPVLQELRVANGDRRLLERLEAHHAHFSYGENIGNPDCPVPSFPFPTKPMRQPVVLDYWVGKTPSQRVFTTVTNWEVKGYDCEYKGELYTWSKHHEYLKILDLPRRTDATLQLAIGLSGVTADVQRLLRENGWLVLDAYELSLNPWSYRDYICGSGAEFTVAKDMNVRLRSGWFSERSACYLAAGRPVVTQDTGFSQVLPTGEGLFAFQTIDDILAGIDAINSDYERHSRAARSIAEQYFKAETVLAKVLDYLGL